MSILRFLLVGLVAGVAGSASCQQSAWHPAEGRNKPGGESVTCPPGAQRPFEAISKDADIDNNGKTDRYLGEFRWDDKKGNDFKVEVWCMDDTYFSVRVYQSTEGKETLVATPGGKDSAGGDLPDPGKC